MAHPVCGVDIGSYSVKITVLDVGFRHTGFRENIEVRVPAGPEPLWERQLVALRQARSNLSDDATLYFALPGALLSLRTLDLPFSDPRKIDQVVGFELEGQIVHAIDDVVYDHIEIRRNEEGARVMAVAARREDVAQWLEKLPTAEAEPRALFAAPLAYRSLFPRAEAARTTDVKPPLRAILDIGHRSSNLLIVAEGSQWLARTIMRGAGQLVDALLPLAGDVATAEELLRREAAVLTPGQVAATPREAKIDAALRAALAPLLRELRQTLASFRASSGEDLTSLVITGGGSRLRGLVPFLAGELDIKTEALVLPAELAAMEVPHVDESGPPALAPLDSRSFGLAAAIALAGARGTREIDLRRGPFVFRASFSVIRQKAAHLAVLAVAVLVAAGWDVMASLNSLGDEKKTLDAQLKRETTEIFGAPRADAKQVTVALKRGFKDELAPLPTATAFDLLDQISRKLPSDEDIALDVLELDIRPKKIFFKGTVDSATAVDEMAEKLKTIDCVESVQKGAITEVADGAKQFTLNVSSKCP